MIHSILINTIEIPAVELDDGMTAVIADSIRQVLGGEIEMAEKYQNFQLTENVKLSRMLIVL